MKEKILIVDDMDVNLKFLNILLRDRYQVLASNTSKKAIELAQSEQPDLILLDIIMPDDIDGFEICEILKNDPKTKHIPVIFITSRVDEESIVRGYEVGAVDYITKPYKKMELMAKIKTHLKIKSLIEKLEYIATHDTMTGVYNRREFFRLAQEKFESNKDNLFAVMIDIDNFKNINDQYGHYIGDIVIKEFAKIVKEYIKPDTIFGRIGGEEFALICSYEKESKINHRIEILRKAIERTPIDTAYGVLYFTISIGIAKIEQTHKNIDDLLKSADKNLYQAKDEGKNRIVFRSR
jgi:diguanylate cyclase (GGDEF)-like protein